MDFLSGDLDRVFTVLFEMGKIEPMLDKDWRPIYERARRHWPEVGTAIAALNRMSDLRSMREYLLTLEPEILEAIVVEVARELADFHGRTETLH